MTTTFGGNDLNDCEWVSQYFSAFTQLCATHEGGKKTRRYLKLNESENLQISVQDEVGRTCGRIDSAREGWGGRGEGGGEGDFGEKGALH